MSFDFGTLIYDRTERDVAAVAELNRLGIPGMTQTQLTEYLTGLKGAYNYNDLNRVESCVAFLAGFLIDTPDDLEAYGESIGVAWDAFFDVPYDPDDYVVTTVTNWAVTDIPTAAQMARYLGNVSLLITALTATYPTLPAGMANLTYSGANAIEEALLILYNALLAERQRITALLDLTAAVKIYCGQPYCGQIWTQIT